MHENEKKFIDKISFHKIIIGFININKKKHNILNKMGVYHVRENILLKK